ncbi:DUF6596 domain-containing protein [Nocardia paucivorans]|uniref:DUF6596 domain-containing protein n=1 Tax=Nocardia paucivorans TaxID=114259 RepID=UPI0003024691|nr:DUF6596 domain-containing protein [Nocardia paucivorans]
MAAVLQVLYLIFNEGYTATAGSALTRVDLTTEAIRLTRMLHAAVPDDAEVTGLLALMLLTESCRTARTDGDELIPLDQQDPTRWNREMIVEGTALIDSVWAQIAMLYLWLEFLTPTPPVQLARVVAVAHAYGPARGLALLDDLNRRHNLHSNPLTRHAHLLQQLGDNTTAAGLFRRAAEFTDNRIEQRYLHNKAGHVDNTPNRAPQT